jgi:hypothetical protein
MIDVLTIVIKYFRRMFSKLEVFLKELYNKFGKIIMFIFMGYFFNRCIAGRTSGASCKI